MKADDFTLRNIPSCYNNDGNILRLVVGFEFLNILHPGFASQSEVHQYCDRLVLYRPLNDIAFIDGELHTRKAVILYHELQQVGKIRAVFDNENRFDG